MIVVTVARRPLAASNVASNVLEHGTGALHVDASRIGTFRNTAPSGMDRYNAMLADQGYRPGSYQQGAPPVSKAEGRWPANLILEHMPGCVRVGDAKVKVPTHRNPSVVASNFCHGQFEKRPDRRKYDLADDDGTEVVAVWDCEVGCPIAGLDGQTWKDGSNGGPARRSYQDQEKVGGVYGQRGDGTVFGYPDAGGASRYFKQVGGKE